MKAIVGAELRLQGGPPEIVARLKQAYTFTHKAKKPDRRGKLVEVEFCVPLWRTEGDDMLLPRGALDWRPKSDARQLRETCEVAAATTRVACKVGKSPTLRDYQDECLAIMRKCAQGVVEIACGGGKTIIGVAAAASFGQRTLIAVHTREIADQWIAKIGATGCTVEKFTLGDIEESDHYDHVVGTVQSLVKCPPDHAFWRGFGMCIMDEAHHAPASTFESVVARCPAHRRYAFTATPQRADRREAEMYAIFGGTIYRRDPKVLADDGYTLKPHYKALFLDYPILWKTEHNNPLTDAIGQLVEIEARTAAIEMKVLDLLGEGHTVAVLCARTAHAALIAHNLRACGKAAASVEAATTPKQRKKIYEDLQNGALKIICATRLLDEGFDVPCLSAVVLADPSNSKSGVVQRIGRVMRKSAGKLHPVVVQVVDYTCMPLKACARKLKNTMRDELGMDCKGWGEFERDTK